MKYKSGKSHQCDCPPSLGEVMGGGGYIDLWQPHARRFPCSSVAILRRVLRTKGDVAVAENDCGTLLRCKSRRLATMQQNSYAEDVGGEAWNAIAMKTSNLRWRTTIF